MIKYKCKDRFGITGIVEVEGRLLVTKEKNGKNVFAGDETNKGIAIAGFENWVWTYIKDFSTYHWHINIQADIELIEEKEDD